MKDFEEFCRTFLYALVVVVCLLVIADVRIAAG